MDIFVKANVRKSESISFVLICRQKLSAVGVHKIPSITWVKFWGSLILVRKKNLYHTLESKPTLIEKLLTTFSLQINNHLKHAAKSSTFKNDFEFLLSLKPLMLYVIFLSKPSNSMEFLKLQVNAYYVKSLINIKFKN